MNRQNTPFVIKLHKFLLEWYYNKTLTKLEFFGIIPSKRQRLE